MKKILLGLMMMATAIFTLTSCSGAKEKMLQQAVAEASKQLPMKVVEGLEVTKIEAENSTMVYTYTVADNLPITQESVIKAVRR